MHCTDGGISEHLSQGAAAVLLLDGTLRLKSSFASHLSLGDSRVLSAVGGGANSHMGKRNVSTTAGVSAEVNLVSCAAAVTCGGAGEPSTLDGTGLVSRLVPFTAADSNGSDSNGEHQVQFAPR